MKRIFYNYFLRDFTIATIEMCIGVFLIVSGLVFGFWQWNLANMKGHATTSGNVMIAALPIVLGFQLLLSALEYDIHNVPRECIHTVLP